MQVVFYIFMKMANLINVVFVGIELIACIRGFLKIKKEYNNRIIYFNEKD